MVGSTSAGKSTVIRAPVIALGFALVLAVGAGGAVGANLGRDIAATCANCHGTDGRSRGGVPSLAGQDRGYLIRQMHDFRDGKRPSTVMQQLAKGYTDAEIEAAAAYFAAQQAK
jgi:cytochrome subunit of sulfide dehydrogenase